MNMPTRHRKKPITPVERAARALYIEENQRLPQAREAWDNRCSDLLKGMYARFVTAALTAAVEDREGLARVLAESMPCTWSIPQDEHPYDDGCVHRRGGQGRGACWDQAWELAAAVARWLTGEEA